MERERGPGRGVERFTAMRGKMEREGSMAMEQVAVANLFSCIKTCLSARHGLDPYRRTFAATGKEGLLPLGLDGHGDGSPFCCPYCPACVINTALFTTLSIYISWL